MDVLVSVFDNIIKDLQQEDLEILTGILMKESSNVVLEEYSELLNFVDRYH